MKRRLVIVTASIAAALVCGGAVAFATSVDEWLIERANDPASKLS